MFIRLFERWSKSDELSHDEMRVLKKLLSVQSPHSPALLSQAEQAPYIERRLSGDCGFDAIIPYVNDDSLLIECDCNLKSPEFEIVDSKTGRRLRFFTEVLRGGFLRGLSGYAVDGKGWPKNWTSDFRNIRWPPEGDSWLEAIPLPAPEPDVLMHLVKWCGIAPSDIPPGQRGLLRLARAARDTDLRDCEARLSVRLHEQYEEFARISNGVSIRRGRPYEILGTADLEFIGTTREWVGLTPLYEDGYVAMKVEGDVVTPRCFLLSGRGPVEEIGDCKKHIRDSLLWED